MFSALMLQTAGSRNCLKIEQNIRVGGLKKFRSTAAKTASWCCPSPTRRLLIGAGWFFYIVEQIEQRRGSGQTINVNFS
jgi:hypothetical protein